MTITSKCTQEKEHAKEQDQGITTYAAGQLAAVTLRQVAGARRRPAKCKNLLYAHRMVYCENANYFLRCWMICSSLMHPLQVQKPACRNNMRRGWGRMHFRTVMVFCEHPCPSPRRNLTVSQFRITQRLASGCASVVMSLSDNAFNNHLFQKQQWDESNQLFYVCFAETCQLDQIHLETRFDPPAQRQRTRGCKSTRCCLGCHLIRGSRAWFAQARLTVEC